MTAKEFDNYNRGIAHDTIKLENGEITIEEFGTNMRVQLGRDAFEEAASIMKERTKK